MSIKPDHDTVMTEQPTDNGEVVLQAVLAPLPEQLTYAAVVDAHQGEIEITDLMIKRACKEMEQYEQFPFAPKK